MSLRSRQALHSDHLGSTSATSGATTSSQVYYPFGGVRATTGSVPTDYGFTGQKLDASDGLMYYNARYYDPALGRFISADRMVPNVTNPQTLDRYSYVKNNPIRLIDPTGNWDPEDLAKALGKNWKEKYFGEKGVFNGKDNLYDFLTSDKTTNSVELEIIQAIFEAAALAHDAGFDFTDIDTLGVKVTLSGGGRICRSQSRCGT